MVSYKTKLAPVRRIEDMIFLIRGQRVMLDFDLAKIYGVTTRRLKEQFRRNADRFPGDFAFQLEYQEFANLRSQFATAKGRGGNSPNHSRIGIMNLLPTTLASWSAVPRGRDRFPGASCHGRTAAGSPMPKDGGPFSLSWGERAGVRAVFVPFAFPFRTPHSALRIPQFRRRCRR